MKLSKKLATPTSQPGLLSRVEQHILGVESERARNNQPMVALKYYDPSFQCFSEWTPPELKAFSNFCKRITQSTWPDILSSGGKAGRKKGFGHTVHKNRSNLPKSSLLDKISEDIAFFELRVSKKSRVHGFRCASAFFLCWLDRNHEIYPE